MTVAGAEAYIAEASAKAPVEGVQAVHVSHGTFRCRRGYDLYTTTFTPATRRTSACLVFHHGLSDHTQRHAAVLSHLCSSLGMPVYTYDAHGHGRSGPPGPASRALILSFDHMVTDLLDFTRLHVVPAEEQDAAAAAQQQQQQQQTEAEAETEVGKESAGTGGRSGRPRIFLLGYSMGGLACSLAMAASLAPSASSSSSSSSAAVAVSSSSSATSAPPATSAAPTRAPPGEVTGRAAGGEMAGAETAELADGKTPSHPQQSGPQQRNGYYHANGGKANGHGNGVHAAAAGTNGAAVPAAAAGAAGREGEEERQALLRSPCGSTLFEGLMLTSGLTDPLHGVGPVARAVRVAFVTALSWLAPSLALFRRNPVEMGIRDPVAVAEMAADTLWYRGKLKVGTVASLLSGCARLRRAARRLAPVPLYVQHATVDVACSLASMRAHLARVRPEELEMHVVEGAYHDLHHDPETPVLLGHMVDWLRKRV